MKEPEVLRVAEVESTQDLARGLPVGSVVVTDHQTAGRGRLSRSWQAPPGTALLASFVLPAHPLASLAAGVAAAEACGAGVRLKWPNDLLLDGKKLGGILVESLGARAVVGVGVNLTWAPEGAARLPTARDELLWRLGASLLSWFEAPPHLVLERWRRLSATLGQRVRVELAGETVEGLAEDVAPDGALLVGGRTIFAGDVIHLRPAAPAPSRGAAEVPPPTCR